METLHSTVESIYVQVHASVHTQRDREIWINGRNRTRLYWNVRKEALRLLDQRRSVQEVTAWFRQWDMGKARRPISSRSIYNSLQLLHTYPGAKNPEIEKGRYSRLCCIHHRLAADPTQYTISKQQHLPRIPCIAGHASLVLSAKSPKCLIFGRHAPLHAGQDEAQRFAQPVLLFRTFCWGQISLLLASTKLSLAM